MSVVTEPRRAGQSVTVDAQEVMVYTEVLKTVEVVRLGAEVVMGPVPDEEVRGWLREDEVVGKRGVLKVAVGLVTDPWDEVDVAPPDDELGLDTVEVVACEDDEDAEVGVEEVEVDIEGVELDLEDAVEVVACEDEDAEVDVDDVEVDVEDVELDVDDVELDVEDVELDVEEVELDDVVCAAAVYIFTELIAQYISLKAPGLAAT
jgi:hypothetical protein